MKVVPIFLLVTIGICGYSATAFLINSLPLDAEKALPLPLDNLIPSFDPLKMLLKTLGISVEHLVEGLKKCVDELGPEASEAVKKLLEGKKCLAVYQPEEATNFTLAGCVSTRTYRPKYCGVCTDNRCCIPYKSKTISVDFQCPEGPGFSRQVLWINACFCNLSCRNPNDIFADLESYPDFAEIAN